MELVKYLTTAINLDTTRFYITGGSNGGYATWEIITRYPGVFCCAVPVCGAGDPTKASRLVNTPIWAWHCTDDGTVPFSGTRDMIDSITVHGGTPRHYYGTGCGHAAWIPMGEDTSLFSWIFSHTKTIDTSKTSLELKLLSTEQDSLSLSPNPFNPNCKISINLNKTSFVNLEIYNQAGKLVNQLISKEMGVGVHHINWNGITNSGKMASSGLYFCKFTSRGKTISKKIIFSK